MLIKFEDTRFKYYNNSTTLMKSEVYLAQRMATIYNLKLTNIQIQKWINQGAGAICITHLHLINNLYFWLSFGF